jgi:Raf kinase inhibitor-like YbhB/YbcL family protein
MRQVSVEPRFDGHAALAPALVLLFATVAGCTSGGAASSDAVAATPGPTEVVASPSTAASAASTGAEETAMATSPSPSTTTAFSLSSEAFDEGAPIPREYTCHGSDVSPELAWQGVPAGAGALVLFVDDPDGRDWVHWTVLDLPASDGSLPKGVDPSSDPPQQGTNDFHKVGYGGPCPPSGTHHYRFTLYALGAPLELSGHPDGDTVRRALDGAKVVGRVRLTGTSKA